MRAGIPVLCAAAAAVALGAAGGAGAAPKSFTLPPETAALRQTADAGYENTANTCGACHSLDYITTQPPGKGPDFWTAEVSKMVTVYGATVAEADRASIIDYLARTY
jgi:hypothetical protein